MANRGSLKMTDGSLSDTQTYAEVKTDYGSYAMWLKHSNTATSRLSEGDTIDNVGIGSPARAHKLMQRESTYTTQSPRLNRSNSIRWTLFHISNLNGILSIQMKSIHFLPLQIITFNVWIFRPHHLLFRFFTTIKKIIQTSKFIHFFLSFLQSFLFEIFPHTKNMTFQNSNCKAIWKKGHIQGIYTNEVLYNAIATRLDIIQRMTHNSYTLIPLLFAYY